MESPSRHHPQNGGAKPVQTPDAAANLSARLDTVPSGGRRPRIAVVTMGVKLGDETRGYTRFRFLSELLVREGFDVDLFTSSFQHWEKAQRDTARACYRNLPYRVRFIEEPGYKKNLDLTRIRSHRIAAKNLRRMLGEAFAHDPRAYNLIYAEIPPNDVARTCAEVARDHGIPFVADINDLWPEAMRMAVSIPVVSDIAFHPFARDAKATYRLLSAAVGTSDEYAARPLADREAPCPTVTVYVGNDLATFDAGVAAHAPHISKPAGEFWVTYAGTLGASYDIATLVEAASALNDRKPSGSAKHVRMKILGDGPDRASLEELAARRGAPVDFLGYTPYDQMAAYLSASDVTVNSLVASAPQSIVTKIGDYLASGKPLINTGSSPEFRAKVAHDGFGVNVPAENVTALADAICDLAANPQACADMGARGRAIAEQQFDQPKAYLKIVDLIRSLL
ncbi:glycosyltransferase family 4 protein [Adlercreutzia sp. ZJ242]|uniref:glycosyltransferase family 4 protein n=1 Tax=Adlercreutzia sp. ZJ242 TaxID=2709409 RepID=UPI001F154954|nr:glycosyltransferase family 4 protein [Adlercreutzia sp. ZJ242]